MTYSSDPGSARFAGRLGTFERGVMLPPIDEAVFSMSPGDVSPPVETQLGSIKTTAKLGDYREVDGIQVPFEMRQSAVGQEMVMRLTDVAHNIELAEDAFTPPESVQALLEQGE